MKIPGILYPENSDFARRSRTVAWRAAVESSTSVEQLAIQVRSHIFLPFIFYLIRNFEYFQQYKKGITSV